MLPDAYGCAVANRYGDLLDDDADPFDMISKVQMEKDVQKKKKKEDEDKRGKQKKPGQKESQKDRRLPVAPEGPDPAPGQLTSRSAAFCRYAPRIQSDSGSCAYF